MESSKKRRIKTITKTKISDRVEFLEVFRDWIFFSFPIRILKCVGKHPASNVELCVYSIRPRKQKRRNNKEEEIYREKNIKTSKKGTAKRNKKIYDVHFFRVEKNF